MSLLSFPCIYFKGFMEWGPCTFSKEAALESTYAMPITRDLSAGKRLTLQLWIYLVANNYNVPDLMWIRFPLDEPLPVIDACLLTSRQCCSS